MTETGTQPEAKPEATNLHRKTGSAPYKDMRASGSYRNPPGSKTGTPQPEANRQESPRTPPLRDTAASGGYLTGIQPPPFRLALKRSEAAAALGISLDSFEEHIQPELRLVRVGRLVLVPVAQLAGWVERNAAMTIEASS